MLKLYKVYFLIFILNLFSTQALAGLWDENPPPPTPNGAPSFNGLGGPYTVNAGESVHIDASATDPDNDALAYSASGLPEGASFDTATGSFSWQTTRNTSGDFVIITFTVSDGINGPVSANATVTVVPIPNGEPLLSVNATYTFTAGKMGSFTVTATDPDDDEIDLSVGETPVGAEFDEETGIFSWTPSCGDSGTYSVTFKADDGQGHEVTTTTTIIVLKADSTEYYLTMIPEAEKTLDSLVLKNGCFVKGLKNQLESAEAKFKRKNGEQGIKMIENICHNWDIHVKNGKIPVVYANALESNICCAIPVKHKCNQHGCKKHHGCKLHKDKHKHKNKSKHCNKHR